MKSDIPSIGKNCQMYLPLALSFKVYNTHIHNGAEIGEGFHGHYIWALFITVHVELGMKIRLLNLKDVEIKQNRRVSQTVGEESSKGQTGYMSRVSPHLSLNFVAGMIGEHMAGAAELMNLLRTALYLHKLRVPKSRANKHNPIV